QLERSRDVRTSSRRSPDDAARRESERRSSLSGADKLMELGGVDEEVVQILGQAAVHSPEDLVKTPIEQVASATGIDMGDLAKLRQRALSWLAQAEGSH